MATNDRPNVLLITADHWAGRFLGVEGHPVMLTPTLDQLARNGTRFAHAYSLCPVCIPARRSLMTGMFPRSHGDRGFNEHLEMPDAPTLASTFHDHGYQTYAVGKLHVYPQRDRIGFDDVILNEEGRRHLQGREDDFEWHLAERGFSGLEYAGAGSNNDYNVAFWHLPEDCHPTVWAARNMCRVIRRRDPKRPALWYLSFVGPHQPVWPTQAYYDLYREFEIDDPVVGDWVGDFADRPAKIRSYGPNSGVMRHATPAQIRQVRRAFYATMTQIDHQIRVVIGTLREEGVLNNTWIIFTADHGDMLGDHKLWAKGVHYDSSARIPMLVVPPPSYLQPTPVKPHTDGSLQQDSGCGYTHGTVDNRLVCLEDVMPTILEAAGLPIPDTVEGISMLSDRSRDFLYGEQGAKAGASRMIREERYKLIYYGEGNRCELFDMKEDPTECHNLANDPDHADTLKRLKARLIDNLYGEDLEWLDNGQLIGMPRTSGTYPRNHGLTGQRGLRYL